MKNAPDWISAVVATVVVVGSGVGIYTGFASQMASFKDKIEGLEDRYEKGDAKVSEIRDHLVSVNLEFQTIKTKLYAVEHNQGDMVRIFDKLSSALDKLGIAVARLEERMKNRKEIGLSWERDNNG